MIENKQQDVFVPKGMPDIDMSGRATSFFEFWPTWIMYMPVALQWGWLSLRYRSLSLPLIANPAIPLSGMVGVPKSAVFDRAGEQARNWILSWLDYEVTAESAEAQQRTVSQLLSELGLSLPIVGKPNLGCRGVGVKLLQTEAELREYLESFPVDAAIQFQELADWEAEAGVFYVRHPDHQSGQITSLTLKYMPYVIGDGEATLAQLIARDPRAGQLQHLYQARHAHNWDKVIEVDQPYRLIFAASHSRGAVFRNGNDYITEKLSKTLDTIFDDIPGFHYGRLDIKFRDLDSLMNGEGFSIIEINGASSESIHIWDRHTDFSAAVKTLLQQYQTLFTLGHANRQRGHRPPGLRALWDAWRHESKLVKQYPGND
ncbi:MAG: D-alanine--D-alanine ligase [Gammaproteobacteria bacterium]|nr:D-alanine--D-alanine ligase [Gammaproteobacteria bacterium]